VSDRIPEQEIMDVLHAIERGDVAVLPPVPFEHYCGSVEHKTSNGWTFVIFDDCGEWDYIETVMAPDGRCLYPWAFLDEVAVTREQLGEGIERHWKQHWTYDAYERLRNYSAEDRNTLHRWPTWD